MSVINQMIREIDARIENDSPQIAQLPVVMEASASTHYGHTAVISTLTFCLFFLLSIACYFYYDNSKVHDRSVNVSQELPGSEELLSRYSQAILDEMSPLSSISYPVQNLYHIASIINTHMGLEAALKNSFGSDVLSSEIQALKPKSRFVKTKGKQTKLASNPRFSKTLISSSGAKPNTSALKYLSKGDKASILKAIKILTQRSMSLHANTDEYEQLASAYQKIGQHKKAISLYQNLLSLKHPKPIWHVGLAVSLEAVEQFDLAKRHYYNAYELGDPRSSYYPALQQKLTLLIKKMGGNS